MSTLNDLRKTNKIVCGPNEFIISNIKRGVGYGAGVVFLKTDEKAEKEIEISFERLQHNINVGKAKII